MAKVSVALNATDANGKSFSKTLNDISGVASAKQITDLNKALIGLTTNTYEASTRVEKTNLDTEEVDGLFAYLKVGTVSSTEEGAMWLEEG